MRIGNLLLGASVSALVLAGMGIAQPAWAQADTSPSAAPAKAVKKKPKADEVKANPIDADEAAAIVITARRRALLTATELKRNADTIIDSIVADEAGKLPDNSITEVLQRVSGVSISRFVQGNGGNTAFQIEGTGITVRGLPFNSSTLNGQQLFSANGASAISWNEVTPELMAGVDVYKATRADIIEGGASSIDLRTHLPFDFKDMQFNVSAGGSYGTMAKKSSPRLSAMLSKRYDTAIGEIGVLWDLAYSRLYQQSSDLQVGAMFAEYAPTSNRADHLAFIPSSFGWSNSKSKRDRYGAYQALQWKPASNLTLTNTIFYSEYRAQGQGNGGGVGTNPSATAEVMPVVGSSVAYDANGAFRKGSLTVASTGKSEDWGNTTASDTFKAANGSWFPAEYMIDCGATYGTPASSILWDWSFAPGTKLAQCGPAATLNPTGSANASRSKSSTLDISQSFVWTPVDRVAVRGGAQYVSSRASGRDMYVGINQSSPLVTSVNADLTGSLPVVSGLSTAGILDKSKAYFPQFGYHEPKNKGKMLAGHLDAEFKVSDGGFLRSITIGGRLARRTEKDNFAGTYWSPLGQSWMGNTWGDHTGDPTYGPGNIKYLTNSTVPASDYQIATFKNFFGGKITVPAQVYVPSDSLMQSFDWYHLIQTYNGPNTGKTKAQLYHDNIDNGLGGTDSRITNMAAYVEARFASDGGGIIPRFSGNIGVRVFHESTRSHAFLTTPQAANLALSVADSTAYFNAQNAIPGSSPVFPTLYGFTSASYPSVRAYSYTRVLPSFNIKFDVTSKFIVRGAASISSSPPNLNDVRAGGSISPRTLANPTNAQAPSILTGVINNGGGANLKPTMIKSEDLSFEYYPSSSSLFYVDLFAKQIKDEPLFYSFIANNLPIPALAYAGGPAAAGTTAVGTPTTLNLPWLYLQNKSSEKTATIKGFEIGGRKFFDKLPGLLSGFGIEGNVTYIDSHNPAQQANSVLGPAVRTNGGLNADGTVPQTYPNLPYNGLSKWAYNIQLLYSKGKVNFRLAYNWRDKALLSTNVNPLSYATSGGNPYTLNTSPTNFDSAHSYPVYNMVPAYMAAAGYLDLGFDYKVNEKISLSFGAGNVLNTISRTLQETIPGVFQPYDYNVSDRRYDVSIRVRF